MFNPRTQKKTELSQETQKEKTDSAIQLSTWIPLEVASQAFTSCLQFSVVSLNTYCRYYMSDNPIIVIWNTSQIILNWQLVHIFWGKEAVLELKRSKHVQTIPSQWIMNTAQSLLGFLKAGVNVFNVLGRSIKIKRNVVMLILGWLLLLLSRIWIKAQAASSNKMGVEFCTLSYSI